jgi:hypothetical protein
MKIRNFTALAGIIMLPILFADIAFAANEQDTYKAQDGYHNVPGVVTECVTGGVASPCSPGGSGGGSSNNIASINGTTINLGQTTMSGSLPVAIANNQSPIPITGTISANQSGAPWQENIVDIGGQALTLGQALMAGSLPVTIASNQAALPVSGSITDSNLANAYIAGTAASPVGDIIIGAQYEAAPISMPNGDSGPLQLTAAGALTVAQEDVQLVQTLSLTSTANVSIFPIANGQATMAMEAIGLTGSGATIGFYGSMDGVNYAAIGLHQNTLAYATTLNANSILFRLDVAGLKYVEVSPTVAGTGSVVLTANISSAFDRAVTLAGNFNGAAPNVQIVNLAGNALANGQSTGHLGPVAGLATANYNAPLEGYTEQTAAGPGTPDMDAYGAAYSDTEGVKPTYQSWSTITPIAGITYSMCGSATKQVRVRQISLNGFSNTTAGGLQYTIVKTSTAPTTGTSTAATDVQNQSTDAASTIAAPLIWSVAPTSGTTAGFVGNSLIGFPLLSAVTPANIQRYGAIDDTKSVVLTGIAQCLEVNMLGTPPSGAQLVVGVTWTEQ